MSTIRIAQFIQLSLRNTSNRDVLTTYNYQNYFVNESKTYAGVPYSFAPFRAEGTTITTTGDNPVLQVLFPNIEFALQILHNGDGNRLSRMTMTTVWLTADSQFSPNAFTEYYVGLGSSISETTIELRFRSAVDSVSNNFPNHTLTLQNAGPLPLDSQLRLQ